MVKDQIIVFFTFSHAMLKVVKHLCNKECKISLVLVTLHFMPETDRSYYQDGVGSGRGKFGHILSKEQLGIS